MASGGRRSKLGSLHGPMNGPSLNGTHPAMLAAQRFVSDVQLPYKFQILPATHSGDRDEDLLNHGVSDDEIWRGERK